MVLFLLSYDMDNSHTDCNSDPGLGYLRFIKQNISGKDMHSTILL